MFSRRKRGVLRTPLLCRRYKTARSLHASSESSQSRTSTCSLFCESHNAVHQYTKPRRICWPAFKSCFFLDNKFVLEICIWICVSMFKLFVAQEARISVLGENDRLVYPWYKMLRFNFCIPEYLHSFQGCHKYLYEYYEIGMFFFRALPGGHNMYIVQFVLWRISIQRPRRSTFSSEFLPLHFDWNLL